MHNCVQPDMVKTFPFFLCQNFQQKQPIKELLKVDNLGKILSGDGIQRLSFTHQKFLLEKLFGKKVAKGQKIGKKREK